MPMISVIPSPTDKISAPKPMMINTALVQVIENADFVPEAPKATSTTSTSDAKATAAEKPFELHQPAPAPIVRTKITMHSGAVFFVAGSVAETAALVG